MRKLWSSDQPNQKPDVCLPSTGGFRLMTETNLDVAAGHLAVQTDITRTGNAYVFFGIAPRNIVDQLPCADDLADSPKERMCQSHVRERCL